MKDARDVLRQKEIDRARIQSEIEALQLVIPLLTDEEHQSDWKAESPTEQRRNGTDGPFFASIGETESQLWNSGKHRRGINKWLYNDTARSRAQGESDQLISYRLLGRLAQELLQSRLHARDFVLQSTLDDLVKFVAEARRSGRGKRGRFLDITSLPLKFWSKPDELNSRFSTEEYADLPLLLEGADGHTGWANRALLREAGVTKEFLRRLSPNERRYYGFGPNMEPNGFAATMGSRKSMRCCQTTPQTSYSNRVARPLRITIPWELPPGWSQLARIGVPIFVRSEIQSTRSKRGMAAR
jgi:hypothetical protein